MTTHKSFRSEAAKLASRFRTSRRVGRDWSAIDDRDLQREINELQLLAQAGHYRARMF